MPVTEYKKPKCSKCGVVLKGFVPVHIEVICFLCDNPNDGEGEEDTNWRDKKSENNHSAVINEFRRNRSGA